MADFPLFGANKIDTYGQDTTATRGTQVTASASTNTKGTWTQITASTTRSSNGGILVYFMTLESTASNEADILIDIGIGATPDLLIENFLMSKQFDGDDGRASFPVYFPINIPAGTEIQARCQSTDGNTIVDIMVMTISNSTTAPVVGSGCDTYGADTSTSGGVLVDPGGTINTKGSYSQLTASSTRDIRFLAFSVATDNNSALSSAQWLIDVAVGAAASEQIIIEDTFLMSKGNESYDPGYFFIPINIPAGSRIAIRAQSDINNASDRDFDIVVYGVY